MDKCQRVERICKLVSVLDALKSDPATPWYLIEIVDQLIDVIDDLDDLAGWHDEFDAALVQQKKATEDLKVKYSEVLYKLKSGD